MNFQPVADLWELDSLDHDSVVEGYTAAERGDPEPGPNRGKSYWYGWRCRMMDLGEIPIDEVHRGLVKEFVERQRRSALALTNGIRQAQKSPGRSRGFSAFSTSRSRRRNVWQLRV